LKSEQFSSSKIDLCYSPLQGEKMPRTNTGGLDRELLQAALEGLTLQRERLDEQIAQVRSRLGGASGRGPGRPPAAAKNAGSAQEGGGQRRRRNLSAAARKRIAAAQKKRWAEFRKQREQSE
jgi:hypothetical protein